jgi:leucyl/phenylalanyl-tRNA--protein transferase
MDPDRLLEAYGNGIFPWSGDPVRWFSPDPRGIFWKIRLPRKLGKVMRRRRFEVTFDEDFPGVIRACREVHAAEGEWITEQFVDAYIELHHRGHAHSVEVWDQGALVGGLYGVQLRGLFAGESMFYRATDSSKIAFAHLVWHLRAIGTRLLDCQMVTEFTWRLGAVLVRRQDYLTLLERAMSVSTRYDGERWPREGAPEVAEEALKHAPQGEPASGAVRED